MGQGPPVAYINKRRNKVQLQLTAYRERRKRQQGPNQQLGHKKLEKKESYTKMYTTRAKENKRKKEPITGHQATGGWTDEDFL